MTQPNLYARRRARRIRPYLTQTVAVDIEPENPALPSLVPSTTPLLRRMALGAAPTEEIPVVTVHPGVSWL
ncbi:hypothetical protein J4H86_02260 [Spiractinospora alimapuensis]|uniref:hypothetical protein n=1 Tax=Spiractinospora alimapuensis TaxID=2820884 RepID=UPI001F2874B4|nr:hypothetical protein [Spiractinospora alimapuensis]QVQ52677.1 hypothetical protein J4H86_02260 [Spiractinospora alimapuensis]